MQQNCVTTILIGNPGVGKSTYLNAFLGEIKFKSGVSLGKGLTSVCQTVVDYSGNRYVDTPGLSDVKLRKKAAEEIKSALSAGGMFKIFFVITLEEGRIRPDDKTTMKLVLDCAPIGSLYAIVINKLQPEILEILRDEREAREFVVMLNEDLPGTKYIHYNAFDSKLSAKPNVLTQLPPDFFSFVMSAPMLVIRPSDVKDIKQGEFDALREELSRQLEILRTDNQAMANRLEEQSKTIAKITEENAKRQDAMIKEHNIRIDEITDNFNRRMIEMSNNKASPTGFFGSIGNFLDALF